MSAKQKGEKSIFKAALELKTPAERTAYMDKVCAADPTLKSRILALLEAHEDKSDFLDALLDEPVVSWDDQCLKEKPGTIIGRYKLLEQIGEGGMAVVYMAEQEKPIRRKIALKIIKLGMDTKQVIARFEAERQALAMMDHANIAKVLDAGATETGRPYFVMELVTGVSITEYCDKNNLSTKERLALFIEVCKAVQHAHQKGIIHRDLKPSNVMVTHRDGTPVPKIIDFGIAKAINQRLTEKTLFTRYAHIIGTPAYMSPEQAELSELDVDTRTDIYSLGVLLYELLTGTTPFSEEQLRKAGYIEMQRVIREEEPTKPSTKLSTFGETLTEIAKHRASTPDLLRKAIRGDLDWIVMKSLEKDRIRRYETANGLAMDIQRHVDHEPVLARGPSTTYRLHKFLQRHRSQAITALAIALSIVAATVILTMWRRDRLHRIETEGLRHRSILFQAREQFTKADRETALETIKPILESEHVGPEARLLYAGILVEDRRYDGAVAQLEDLVGERPEIAGAAHSLWARVLWESQSLDAEKLREVDEHRQKAQELLPETAEAYFLRAMTALTIKEKLELLDEALRLDPGHYESCRLRAFTYYASRKYERLLDDARAMIVLRPLDSLGYSLRAIAWHQLGQYEEAVEDYDSAISLTATDDPQYVELNAQRCDVLMAMGQYYRVIADARQCLEFVEDAIPLEFRIFCSLIALGDYEEARSLFQQTIDSNPAAQNSFRDWSMKYVFDTLEIGRSWHPQNQEPTGAVFMPMLEAADMYRNLSAKGRRMVIDGFGANWSPDGKKLAFSTGVMGYSGVAIYDPTTQETELLITPGKNPKWSPDGRYLAFVRDCQLLRLEELATAKREHQHRAVADVADEEIWIMNTDGTEPRRLAQGSWPLWSPDAKHLYYLSRVDCTLCWISIEDKQAEPKGIMKFSDSLVSVSPDNQQVAHFAEGFLKIVDMASQKTVMQCVVPSMTWGIGVTAWSPTGHEVCFSSTSTEVVKTGLWIVDMNQKELLNILDGPILTASWSQDMTKIAICLSSPYFEVWSANLDPNISTIEALGPGQTPEEYFNEMIELYTRRINANSEDAESYLHRARYYFCLENKEKAYADMERYRIFSGVATGLTLGTPTNLGSTVNTSSEECALCISADGLSLYFGSNRGGGEGSWDLWMTTRETIDDEWGPCTNLGPPVNSSALETKPCISQDGLTLYFVSNRGGGEGGWDLWMTTRETIDDEWGPCTNLGPPVNSSAQEAHPHISTDGLSLYFSGPGAKGRSEGYGYSDIWVARRASINDGWNAPVNLGPQINSSSWDDGPCVSSDGLYLFFHSIRSGNVDIWVSQRKSTSEAFEKPRLVAPSLLSMFNEYSACISADNRTLYFNSYWPGGSGYSDLWQTSILHWPDDIEASSDASPPEMLPQRDEGKVVVPDTNH